MQFIMSMLIESGALPQEVVTPLQVYRPPYAAARTGWAGLGWHGAESTVEYSASGTVRSVVSCRVVSCRVVSCRVVREFVSVSCGIGSFRRGGRH